MGLRDITREQFEAWAQTALNTPKPPSIRNLAKLGGISKSRLSYQLSSGAVDPLFVILVSRGLELSPRHELARFTGYEALADSPAQPKEEEILTLVSTRDVIATVANRYQLHVTAKPLDNLTGAETWQSWFKIVAPKTTYVDLREITGLSQTAISKNQQAAAWSVDELLNIAEHLRLNPHMALLAAGVLTAEEAGFAYDVRETSLVSAANKTLQSQLERRTTYLADDIARQLEEDAQNAFGTTMG